MPCRNDCEKSQFQILLLPPYFSLRAQAQIPAALAVQHNFICLHDLREANILDDIMVSRDNDPNYQGQPHILFKNTTYHMLTNMWEIQDYIAQCMWDNYQWILSEHGMLWSEEWVSDKGEDEFDDDKDVDEE